MYCRLIALFACCAGLLLSTGSLAAPDRPDPTPQPDRWTGPFGGVFHADFTVASDYGQNGISSTGNQPAVIVGLNWHSQSLLPDGPRLRFYVSALGVNTSFPEAGTGVEIDLAAGFKLGLFDRKLSIDAGYIRYFFPGFSPDFALEFGEFSLRVDYDFGPFTASGRLRYSPDTIGHAGFTWNKRGMIIVPIDFVPLPDGLKLKAYGSLGNLWVEKPDILDLPGNDYWFWQLGVVTSFWGLDLTLAYTDTNITTEGCGNTRACEGRFFASITKVF